MRSPSVFGFLAVLLLTATWAEAAPAPSAADAPASQPPPAPYSLNIGFAQREEGPSGSLTRVIPFWTSRHDKVYDSRDWLVWPLLTGYSRWTDSSEFFSLPILTYAHSDFPTGRALSRWWVCAPLLSGGSQWDRGRGAEGAQTFLPFLSEFAYTPHRHETRLVSIWDFSLFRSESVKGPEEREFRTLGLLDPFWRFAHTEQGESYGWMAPFFDYRDDGRGNGEASIMLFFLKWQWTDKGDTSVHASGAAFERAWPLYLHDAHQGEHHILWPLLYVRRAPNGDSETLIRPLFGTIKSPDYEERGFGPTFWPLERGFPSDPFVVGHRLIQPFTVRTAPDSMSVNILWPLIFQHGEDRRGSETTALLGLLHHSQKPDPFGGEIKCSWFLPIFSKVEATRSKRTLIFPLLWGWEENDSGKYVRPLLIFKVRTGPPSWAQDADKK